VLADFALLGGRPRPTPSGPAARSVSDHFEGPAIASFLSSHASRSSTFFLYGGTVKSRPSRCSRCFAIAFRCFDVEPESLLRDPTPNLAEAEKNSREGRVQIGLPSGCVRGSRSRSVSALAKSESGGRAAILCVNSIP